MITVVFGVSLFVVFAMVVAKLIELKIGKPFMWTRVMRKNDLIIKWITFRSLEILFSIVRRIARFSSVTVPHKVVRVTERIVYVIEGKYNDFLTSLVGRRQVLRNKGSVSFFLRHISDRR